MRSLHKFVLAIAAAVTLTLSLSAQQSSTSTPQTNQGMEEMQGMQRQQSQSAQILKDALGSLGQVSAELDKQNLAAAVVGTRKVIVRREGIERYDLAAAACEVAPVHGTIADFEADCRRDAPPAAAIAAAV